MLIEFRVENHRSIRDEQVLTMEAGRGGESTDTRPRNVSGHKEKLLPAAVIYGANASGKSNFLSAINFMREAVLQSHRAWEPQGGIPRSTFAWGSKCKQSSMFEATFMVLGIKYCYGFLVNDDIVEEEWLFAWPNNRKQVWLERDGDKYKFGQHLKGKKEVIEKVTRPNALFLSTAAQHKHDQLAPVHQWFSGLTLINVIRGRRSDYRPLFARAMFFSDSTKVERFRKLLKEADLGIVDVKEIEDEQSSRRDWQQKILLQHDVGNADSWLSLAEESEGTKTLFEMAPMLFYTLDSGGVLIIDELESSLHPLLAQAIVKTFNCPRLNPKNAQIIFTTHDTNLLGTILGEPLMRRDQIWFAEKDKEGASVIYPLTDYKPRKSENLERGYLQGRYGAIPFLGDLSWMME